MNNSGKTKSRPTFKDWCNASRPQYYIATLIPVTLGFVIAGRFSKIWRVEIFLLVLLASFLLHLAANLANDLFDLESGVDNMGSIGGSIAQREGRISRREYKFVLCLLYFFYMLLSPFIILPSEEPVLWAFAAFGMFSSLYYTAPPFRFGYHALGEALVFLNMGVIMVCGTYMACAHDFNLEIVAFGIIIGLMVAAILFFQSLPEIETDGASGKRTLAVRLGIEKAFFLYYLWWPVVWLLIAILWMCGIVGCLSLGWVLGVPFYLKILQIMSRTTSLTLLDLDNSGYLTRIIYLVTGIFLICGALWK